MQVRRACQLKNKTMRIINTQIEIIKAIPALRLNIFSTSSPGLCWYSTVLHAHLGRSVFLGECMLRSYHFRYLHLRRDAYEHMNIIRIIFIEGMKEEFNKYDVLYIW